MRAVVGIRNMKIGSATFGDDPTPHSAATITCDGCPEEGVQRLTGGFNPHHVRKRFERDGWTISGKKVYCPKCNGRALAPAAPANVIDASRVFKPSAKVIPLVPKTPPTTEVTSDEPEIVVLAPADRAKVRPYLDKHFDDATGRYLKDGGEVWDDKRIAEETGLPLAGIQHYRDTAYAPLAHEEDWAPIQKAITDLGRYVERETGYLKQEADRIDALSDHIKTKVADAMKKHYESVLKAHHDQTLDSIKADMKKMLDGIKTDLATAYEATREQVVKHIDTAVAQESVDMGAALTDYKGRVEQQITFMTTNLAAIKDRIEERMHRNAGLKL